MVWWYERRHEMCVMNKTTVLPAKSDSEVIFCLQSYQGLDRSLVY